MEELSPAQVASLPKGTVISRLRFIPKTDSMRPITRVVGADAKTRVHWHGRMVLPFISVSLLTEFALQLHQARVRDLLDMLQACVRSTLSLLGSTVWGMTDIHRVLGSLARSQKDKPQRLYFVNVSRITLLLRRIHYFIWGKYLEKFKALFTFVCVLRWMWVEPMRACHMTSW